MKSIYKRSLLYLIFVMCSSPVFAIHIQGMDLTYTCSGNNTYTFTLHFYRDCAGISPVIKQLVIKSNSHSFSKLLTLIEDMPLVDISPVVKDELANTTCNRGTLPGSQEWSYSCTYQLPFYAKDWVFYYNDVGFNPALSNILDPANDGMRITDSLDNSSGQSFNSPTFSNVPIFYVVNSGVSFTYNPGAYDADGDSLVYVLTAPLDTDAQPISYATGTNYNYDSSLALMPGVPFVLNKTTGQMSFTPYQGQQQGTMLAERVYIYRAKKIVSYITREFEILTFNATNTIPSASNIQDLTGGVLTSPISFTLAPNTKASFQITATDLNVPKEAISVTSNASVVLPNSTISVQDTNPAIITLVWTPTFADTGYHNFTITVKDDNSPIFGANKDLYGVQVYSYQIYVPSAATGIANLATMGSLSVEPNPFSSQTVLQYDLANDNSLTINIYDVTGRLVQQVMNNANVSKGVHQQTLDLSVLPSGMYFLDVMNSESQHSYAKLIKQ